MATGPPPLVDPLDATVADDAGCAETQVSAGHVEASASRGPQPGERVGRFVIRGQLGAGGMGVVYEAHDPELDRAVAIKLIRADRRAPGAVDRLRREAQAAARLSHPNVVTVYDVGSHGDDAFVAMELVRGQTLRQWLSAETPTWDDIVAAYVQAAGGLQAAHDAGMAHRDFKPDNALIADGRVRVADFGLARPQGEPGAMAHGSGEPETLSVTQTGAVVGTPRYMAPEQRMGQPADAQSDQYAFAVALYEALYREHPFEGGRSQPPPAPQIGPVPGSVHRALVRSLSLDPAQRFASMGDLMNELATAIAPSARSHRRKLTGFAMAAAAAAALVLYARGVGQEPPAQAPGNDESSAAVTSRSAEANGAEPEADPAEVAIATPGDSYSDDSNDDSEAGPTLLQVPEPHAGHPQLARAASRYEAGDYRAAAAALEAAYGELSEPTLLYNLAVARQQGGDPCGALAALDRFTGLAPDQLPAQLGQLRATASSACTALDPSTRLANEQPPDRARRQAKPARPAPANPAKPALVDQ